MQDQQSDIRQILRVVHVLRKYPWILKTPFNGLQKFVLGQHRILADDLYWETVLNAIGIEPKHDLEFYRHELFDDQLLRECYTRALAEKLIPQKAEGYEARLKNRTANVVNYYALIRETRPRVIVETGTASGSMTSWMLAALDKNRDGKLISIDIPPRAGTLTMDLTLTQEKVGCLIPYEYRQRWEYRAGDAKVLLPETLLSNDVDIFVHDSLHTRTHMLYEYNVARTLMRPNTLLLSDDILWNRAFFSFVVDHGLPSFGCISNPNLAIAINSFDEYEQNIGTGLVLL